MSPTISPEELTLLQYLQARSGISGERVGLDPKAIKRALRITESRLAADAASLAAHGLAGVRNTRPDANGNPSTTCSAIWLTSKGEAYLERMPAAPVT
jgi:hypothetical protein